MASLENVLVFIPMYNCERQIPRVLGRIGPDIQPFIREVLIVDNGSRDGSVAAATAAIAKLSRTRATIVANVQNYNLGGSHKVAFNYAIEHGFDTVIVLHGDDQADINDLLPLLRSGEYRQWDQLLGSRFMRGASLKGYSRFRTFGNYVYNWIFSIAARRRLHDLGSGLNLYRTTYLRDRFYLTFPDALTFNNHMLLAGVYRKAATRFFPISWREEDQRSNVKMVRQALRTLYIPARYLAASASFLATDYSSRPAKDYTYRVIASHVPDQAADVVSTNITVSNSTTIAAR